VRSGILTAATLVRPNEEKAERRKGLADALWHAAVVRPDISSATAIIIAALHRK
jgi:hypothetical protein